MASIAPAPYRPERISPPGNTIRDMLDDMGMSQAELARRMGRPPNKLNQIIQGKKAITADTALELESVLALPASFWLNREQNYRLALSEQEREQQQAKYAELSREFPYAEMARLGWVEKRTRAVDRYRELLRFFAVAGNMPLTHVRDLDPSFRKSQLRKANPAALAAWLRRSASEARKIESAEFDKDTVCTALNQLRALTLDPIDTIDTRLPAVAAELGLRIVFVPHLQKTYLGGAAFWMGDIPVISLTFRYRSNDILWFNFFHELGHILLHSSTETWLDDFSDDQEAHEAEANTFAADTLIPPADYATLLRGDFRSRVGVSRFAARIGIAPGNVVGRLQRDGKIPPKNLNDLKKSFSQ